MTQEKFKGIISYEKLRNILSRSEEINRDDETGDIEYWNGKHLFVARKKNTRYWNIFQIIGVG